MRLKLIPALLLGCHLLSQALSPMIATAQDREATRRMLPALHLLQPPWACETMFRESAILLQDEEGGPLVAHLAFPIEEVIEVRSADGSHTLVSGTDFEIGPDKRTLQFAADSKLPYVKSSQLYVTVDKPGRFPHRAGNPQQSLIFQPGAWFHARHFEITYRRDKPEWLSPAPSIDEAKLPRTLATLRAGKPLKLVIAGDSITAGGDASLTFDAPPHMPAFPELIAAQLEESYKSTVTLKNLAVGGASVAGGVASIQKYVDEKPDLLFVGFGMNDVHRQDPKWFQSETKKLIDGVKKQRPDVEIILVAPMLGNVEWSHTPPKMFPLYRDGLAELVGPGVALADLTSAWELLLKHKHNLDMLGNGLNHPNDFGHRMYAQTILALLAPPDQPKAD